MRIICLSDTHGQHLSLNLPEGDLLLHAGDISSRGRREEVAEFLDWFSSQPHRHKVFIGGNHDFLLEQKPAVFKPMIPANCHYLEDSGITLEGLAIWGSPITPYFFDWAFNRHRGAAIRPHWALIPPQTDILLTHGPPYGILDRTTRGEAVGCQDLLKVINRINPRLHVFGHIHEAAGKLERNGTVFVNASYLDLSYRPAQPPFVIDLTG